MRTLEEILLLKARKQPGRPVEWKAMNTKELVIDMTSRKVSGFLAAFGNIDDDQDVLMKGCFAKSIMEHGPNSTSDQKIAYLWMHEMREPVGKFTLLEEQDKGLYFEAIVDPIPLGDRVLTQYQTGTLNQHSIGFRYIWDKCMWADWKGEEAFLVYEVKLMEGSVVSIGMNENTPFTGMKAATLSGEAMILDRETEKLLSRLSIKEQMEMRQLITKHIALAEARVEPGKPLKHSREPQSRKARNESIIEFLKSQTNQ